MSTIPSVWSLETTLRSAWLLSIGDNSELKEEKIAGNAEFSLYKILAAAGVALWQGRYVSEFFLHKAKTVLLPGYQD